MVDALTQNGDERRSMAAISYGEVPSNRYIRKFLNGETQRLYVVWQEFILLAYPGK
jgi:hypothetical protein